ncbi:MAG: hypothetical protein ACPG7F_01665 [Aggregatilineales bacterium]
MAQETMETTDTGVPVIEGDNTEPELAALYEGEEDAPYNLIEPRGAAAFVALMLVFYIIYYIFHYVEIFIIRGG